jgi:GMP synthase (glutamine-hydrolysing)
MGKLLIIKTGSTLPEMKARRGDFEDWTLARLGASASSAASQVVDVTRGEPLPEYAAVSGVVITGSHAMVTEHRDWSEQTARWLAGAVARQVPTLGICYGHQLLAYALGGEVNDNPRGREYGTVEVQLAGEAAADPLLEGWAPAIRVQVCHTQSVVRAPEGALCLAWNAHDACQTFRAGPCAWGVQFHPEFDADVVRTYIDYMRPLLAAEKQDPDALRAATVDTPYGEELLKRFAKLTA